MSFIHSSDFVDSPAAYTVNVLRYLASSNPTSVLTATAVPFSPRPEHQKVDKSFTATLALDNDIFGEIHSNLSEPWIFGIIPRIPKLSATVKCEAGEISIFNYLIPHKYHTITVKPKGKASRVEKAYSFKDGSKGTDSWSTYRQAHSFNDDGFFG